MKIFCYVTGLLILAQTAFATELAPWIGKDKLIEITPCYTYGYYPRINLDGTNRPRSTHYHVSGISVAISPFPDWSVEAESTAASSDRRGYALEDYRITARYLVYNDVIGDPVSLYIGTTVKKATRAGQRDRSTLHHGEMNYEGHVAIGKEFICRQFWTSRLWNAWTVGIANRGSVWVHNILAFDINCWDVSQMGVYLKGYFGGGNTPLTLTPSFHGYGNIRYRAVEWGAYYKREVGDIGVLSISYTQRPWARNFPTHAHLFTLSLIIPYNL